VKASFNGFAEKFNGTIQTKLKQTSLLFSVGKINFGYSNTIGDIL
jgi:hypothetical protein